MSFHKSPTNVNVQRILKTLYDFEKKLDKLQDDVSYHGKTLVELRALVSGLAASTVANPDGKANDSTRGRERNMLSTNHGTSTKQYDSDMNLVNKDFVLPKVRRQNAVQPLPSKAQELIKSFQKPEVVQSPFSMANKASSPRRIPIKNSHIKCTRPSKAEAPRKATTLRTQKAIDKKRSNTL